jgi:preprotein translocase subunit YajC
MHPIFQAFLAQTAEGQPQQNPVMAFLPFIAIAVVFYFVFFRPQAKQQKQHQGFLGGLKKGDEVVTNSGIIGKVVLVEDRSVQLDVGGGTKLRVLKAQIGGAWVEKPASEPVKVEAKK